MPAVKLSQFASTGGQGENKDVQDAVQKYEKLHEGGWNESKSMSYADMVNKYYDLSTSFYEIGWGENFHFAHRLKSESLEASLKRHEHYLAARGGLRKGDMVMDLGCGVGGPAREICRFSGAYITGVNNNEHQVKRAQQLTAASGGFVGSRCAYQKADFMKLPFEEGTYDHAYAIEATCHAPDATACYKEILRCLKPGGCFVCYEWCLRPAFNPDSEDHTAAKRDIELGNGLPGIRTTAEVDAALRKAGFAVEYTEDLVDTAEVEWYYPLDPDVWRWEMLTTTRTGRACSRNLAWCLEQVGIAPKGTSRVSSFLEKGADGLCKGGKMGIFTPMYLCVARKPAT